MSSCSWTCSQCSFINDNRRVGAGKCMMCREPRCSDSTPGESSGSCHSPCTASVVNASSFKNVRFSDWTTFAPEESNEADTTSETSNEKNRASHGRHDMCSPRNMSLAAWKSRRKEWVCKVCTFANQPRFLVCGAW